MNDSKTDLSHPYPTVASLSIPLMRDLVDDIWDIDNPVNQAANSMIKWLCRAVSVDDRLEYEGTHEDHRRFRLWMAEMYEDKLWGWLGRPSGMPRYSNLVANDLGVML